MRLKATPVLALASLACAIGCGGPSVVRVVDGREVLGRYISERAYSLYAQGADAEAHGDLKRALALFEAAAGEDASSPEIWTRVGALRCETGVEGAGAAFDRAAASDADYEPMHRARALCADREKRYDEALREAERALELDPDRDETTLLLASALEHGGKREEAKRALIALTVRRPSSTAAWQALADFAARNGDPALSRSIAQRLDDRSERMAGAVTSVPARRGDHETSLGDLDDAIRAGDAAEVRRRAHRLHLTMSEVAVRAAALGDAKLARDQAELVLGANPSDATARVALAVACDLAHDQAGLAATLAGFGAKDAGARPSPLARVLFAELLSRHAGADAARTFLGAELGASPPSDPLFVAIEARLRSRIGGSTRTTM